MANLKSIDDLKSLLNIRWPIIQGPFGSGLSSIELTAAVSNLGGLGSYGAHYMSPDQIEKLVSDLRAQTNKPFAVNLWVSDSDSGAHDISDSKFEYYRDLLAADFNELGVPLPKKPKKFGERFEAQVEVLLKNRPPVFSFVFGVPDKAILNECRRLNIKTIGAAITVAEALALDEAGVDVIVASGFEAGGHRVAFLKQAEESLVGTFSLVPSVVDRVKRPVIAAGGIVDGRGVAAALTLGASGVQIGSAFLACDESNASEIHKQVLRSRSLTPTHLTRAYSGRLARGIESKFMQKSEYAPFPVQAWLSAQLKPHALIKKDQSKLALWAGQSYSQIKYFKASDLMASLISETQNILNKTNRRFE